MKSPATFGESTPTISKMNCPSWLRSLARSGLPREADREKAVRPMAEDRPTEVRNTAGQPMAHQVDRPMAQRAVLPMEVKARLTARTATLKIQWERLKS